MTTTWKTLFGPAPFVHKPSPCGASGEMLGLLGQTNAPKQQDPMVWHNIAKSGPMERGHAQQNGATKHLIPTKHRLHVLAEVDNFCEHFTNCF